ncbi:hypothetical protein NCS55_00486100 [Fusarium keratoplasticum]|nr:hypothetical protein NCS55_00486100 [Fusarium keratoplasticum]
MDDSTTATTEHPEVLELDASDNEDYDFEPDDSIQSRQLIRLVQTVAGSELFVNSIAQDVLQVSEGNWGAMLSAAPDALGRLGQCFVLASDPLASSLVFPDSAGLPYRSLNTNLIHCSDLGRKAFRNAEERMKRVSSIAEAVCEPGGTVDMVLEAVDDEDLAELDLPDQLAALKAASNDCISHTVAIKEKVDSWRQFATLVHRACVDQDEALGYRETELDGQIEDKKNAVQRKKDILNTVEAQTEEYRRQLGNRQEEFEKARKSQSRGAWADFGVAAGDAIVHSFKALMNPLSGINLNLGFGNSTEQEKGGHDACYAPGSYDQAVQQDAGYVLADRLWRVVHRLGELLTNGPDRLRGVDWERLAGRADRRDNVKSIHNAIMDHLDQYGRENSAVVEEVRKAVKSAETIAATIRDILRDERNVGEDTEKLVADSANEWRAEVKGAETALLSIIRSGVESEKKREAEKRERRDERTRTTKMSRAEIRFERFRMAQQELFDAETRLNKRLEEDMKATEEFKMMEANLQELLTSNVTLSQVKNVVGECVTHLQAFCDKLDQLTSFFSSVQGYVEDIDKYRVDRLGPAATTTLGMKRRAAAEESEAGKLRKEKVAQRKLEELRFKALQLKGHYLVARAVADTYTEVSSRHIIPAVESIDRLSLPSAKSLSKEERAQKLMDVGHLATRARREVKRLADHRRDQFMLAMSDNRGEIEDVERD